MRLGTVISSTGTSDGGAVVLPTNCVDCARNSVDGTDGIDAIVVNANSSVVEENAKANEQDDDEDDDDEVGTAVEEGNLNK